MATILILHGWGSCAKNWSRAKEFLENQGYRVFIPDLPGFGKSPPPPQSWSINDYVNWVEKYINDLQICGGSVEPFFLLGHSFGGSIAVKFTLKYPERIKKLFLVSCAGIRKKTIKKEIIKKIASFFKPFSCLPCYLSVKKVVYRFFIKSDYLNIKNDIMKKTYQNVIKEDISNQFSKISIPTILIWGKKDKLTPIKDAYYIKNAISGARIEVLPNIFHNPHLENPKFLVDKILKNC